MTYVIGRERRRMKRQVQLHFPSRLALYKLTFFSADADKPSLSLFKGFFLFEVDPAEDPVSAGEAPKSCWFFKVVFSFSKKAALASKAAILDR